MLTYWAFGIACAALVLNVLSFPPVFRRIMTRVDDWRAARHFSGGAVPPHRSRPDERLVILDDPGELPPGLPGLGDYPTRPPER